MTNFTQQDLADDIKFFESTKGFSPAYALMALKSYYEHGKGLGQEENAEWLELLVEEKKLIVAFLNKNIQDRKMRIQEYA